MAIFSKKDAARYCGISVETLDRYRDKGRIAFVKIGDRCLFRQNQLDEFLERCTIPATAQPTLREKQAMNVTKEVIGGKV